MTIVDITEKNKKEFNSVATHPLQSFEWGEFRKTSGIRVIRKGFEENKKLISGFQLTIHSIPHTPWNIGYLPKGTAPNQKMIEELRKVGKENNCIFIQLEPNIQKTTENINAIKHIGLTQSAHPLFTRFTFQLDLTKSEEELLKNMHPKTRYNIRVAQKHHVKITEENSEEAFEMYWNLMKETTTRQGFFAHTKKYHQAMWQTLNKKNPNGLEAHLFIAAYKPDNEQHAIPLVAWILFIFHDILYYPYGASSQQYRNVMASQAMMWHAIRFGKEKGLKLFDMWGSLGENPDTSDPWYGFHRLKQGFGPNLIEFVGSFDLVINPLLYEMYKVADKLRWLLLRFRK